MRKLKSLKRVKEIVSVLLKYELAHLAKGLGLTHYVPRRHKSNRKQQSVETQPETLRCIFEELSGAFIKLGQLLSLRPDLVGAAYSKEFEKLLDHMPAEDPEVIRGIVRNKGFKAFSEQPLGSASIAQVHKAYIGDKPVAVKIKRPGIEEKFEEDIRIMEYLARKIRDRYDLGFVDPVQVVEAFKGYTEKELDLKHEAANIRRFRKHFRKHQHVRIPRVYEQYSDHNILVMEYVAGKNILETKRRNKALIRKVTNAVYTMLFEHGFFHADLHPANIFYNSKGEVIFLDFGITGHLDRRMEQKVFNLFACLVDGNLDGTAEALLDLNIGEEEPRVQQLKDGIYNVLADFYDVSLQDISFRDVFYGCIDVARQSRVQFPAHLILFGKSLVSMEGFCRRVDPGFNVVKNARPYVQRMMKRRLSWRSVTSGSKELLIQLHEWMVDFPPMMKDFTRKFGRVEERIIDMDNTFRALNRMLWTISRLITMTLLFSTFFISSIMTMDRAPAFKGLFAYSWFGFGLSAVLFIWILRLLSSHREDLHVFRGQ